MVIPQTKNGSKRSPLSSSYKSKLKQGIAREIKKKLVQERIMGLDMKLKNFARTVVGIGKEAAFPVPLQCPEWLQPFPAFFQFKGQSITIAAPISSHCPPEAKPNSELRSCVGVSTSAMERAEEVRATLSPHFPIFVKLMLKSHVSGGFWLGLPREFCRAHLPECDEMVVLVDEDEQEYDTKYLVDKNGLSGGWRGFSIAHKLLEGDVLVFQLIERCKFKLYIVRATRLTEVDGAMNLLNLDFHGKPSEPENQHEEQAESSETLMPEHLEPLSANNHEKKNMGLVPISEPVVAQPRQNSGSENVDGIRFSKCHLSFKDVKDFKDFHIQVDGINLDSTLPMLLRTKYYELC